MWRTLSAHRPATCRLKPTTGPAVRKYPGRAPRALLNTQNSSPRRYYLLDNFVDVGGPWVCWLRDCRAGRLRQLRLAQISGLIAPARLMPSSGCPSGLPRSRSMPPHPVTTSFRSGWLRPSLHIERLAHSLPRNRPVDRGRRSPQASVLPTVHGLRRSRRRVTRYSGASRARTGISFATIAPFPRGVRRAPSSDSLCLSFSEKKASLCPQLAPHVI